MIDRDDCRIKSKIYLKTIVDFPDTPKKPEDFIGYYNDFALQCGNIFLDKLIK